MNDKYIFATKSLKEMELVLNRHKLLSILEDIKAWRRELYKGYDNNIKYLCNGKLYDFYELEQSRDELPRDEYGIIKDCQSIYLESDLINKIDDLLYDINYLLDY